MSRYLARNLQDKNKDWNHATQERLALVVSTLKSMKTLRMLGFTSYMESMIAQQRLREIDMASKVRWMMVAYNASGMVPSPVPAKIIADIYSQRARDLLPNHYIRLVCAAYERQWREARC
jgi:hypothetical protein